MIDSPLRAFLMIRSSKGKWKVQVFQELIGVIQAWESREEPTMDVGVLHIGFNRPPSKIFDEVATNHLGEMLITAAVKHILPTSFVSSDKPIASVRGLEIYIGLQGWGYSLKDMTVETEEGTLTDTNTNIKEPKDWIPSYIKTNPLDKEVLVKHKIYDDTSYLEAERNLDCVIRRRLGIFRVDYLTGINCSDPCMLAQVAPPWLAQQEWASLNISVRSHNVFKRNNIKIVADLATWSKEKLLIEPNFGNKSLSEILKILKTALSDNSMQILRLEETSNTNLNNNLISNGETDLHFSSSLPAEIKKFLSSLGDRDRDIIKRRLGFETEPQTLAAIARSYKLTRERIRQIESKLLKKIYDSSWYGTFMGKVTQLLEEKNSPLPVAGIEAIDSWLKGIYEQQEFIRKLIATDKNHIHILEIDGILYFSRIEQSIWDKKIEEAKEFLYSSIGNERTETEVRLFVQRLLPNIVQELRPLLWDQVSHSCHFSKNRDGTHVLIGYGQKGVEQIIEVILTESDSPLHYHEIFRRFYLKKQENRSERTIHNACANVGLLFKSGTYGLAQHLPFSDEQMSYICSMAENIVCAEKTKKRWHTSEILSKLPIDDTYRKLDKYLLDIALIESKLLIPLKRMAWTTVDNDETHRINLTQAIVTIIKDAGHPLSADEIKKRLTTMRGVNDSFCIQLIDPLIRVQPGVWGINDRDAYLSRKKQKVLIKNLVDKLNEKQSGIHISELSSVLPLQKCPPYTFLSIASQDERLKLSQRKYIYLTQWGSPKVG